MKIYKKTPEDAVFSADIEEPLANAIRRSVQEIPILAIDEIEVFKNDSVLYDEVLAHRLGLLPLKTDKTMLEKSRKKKSSEKKEEGMLYEAKLKLSKKGPCIVYSGDIGGGAEVVFKEMPLTVLKKGHEIELVATAALGKGIEHAKYSPGMFYYREFYEVIPKKGKDADKEFLENLPILIINPGENGEEPEFERYKFKNGKNTREMYEELKSNVSIEKGKGIIFFAESFGQIKAEEIVIGAIEALKKNLEPFMKN